MTTANPITAISQGDTLLMTCQLDVDGVSQALDDITIRSQVRRSTNYSLLAELTVTKSLDEDGNLTVFDLRAEADITADWPVGMAVIDITYEYPDGTVETTPVFWITINRRITITQP